MSLINEALKKARHEAAGRSDRRHGVLAPSYVPPRRTLLPWLLVAVSTSLAIGVIVGVVLLGRSHSPPVETSDNAATAAVDGETAQTGTRAAPPPSEDGPESADGGSATAFREAEAPLAATSTPAVEKAQETAAAPYGVGEPESVAAEPASIAEAAVEEAPAEPVAVDLSESSPDLPTDGESFLRAVPLGAGRELLLNGIAWSDTGPVALVNGRALEKGEYVEGWQLVDIARQEIRLRSSDVTITVRLK